jgi:hypothetical protein
MTAHDRVSDYLDGALSDDAQASFLDHLADCSRCEAALADELQLRAREGTLERPPQPAVAPARRRLTRWIAAGALLSAAAGALLLVRLGDRESDRETVSLALSPTRLLEPRISYPPAATFRPYDAERGAAHHEAIAPELIARFTRAGDCHGVAVAYLLAGEYEHAESAFAHCTSGPDLDADHAGLAVLRQHPEQALHLADRALLVRPDHPVARWNRALALRDLGLGLAAAEALDSVAATDAAWAAEARARAASLRRDLVTMRESFPQAVEAGRAMVAGGAVIPLDLARRHPATARIFFHDAIRTARTAKRLEDLRPLAGALDGLVGDHLERYLAVSLTPGRLALIDEYAGMVAAQQASSPAFERWLARARTLHADDLVLGALIVTGRVGDAPQEAARLAAATSDPWFELGALAWRIGSARLAGRFAEALELLDRGDRRCVEAKLAYRCVQLTFERAAIERARYRAASAYRLAAAAMRSAEAIGDWPKRSSLALFAGDAQRYLKDRVMARAFFREYALAEATCEARREFDALDAEMRFDEHRIPAARDALRSLASCSQAAAPRTAGSATHSAQLDLDDAARRASQVDQILLTLAVDLASAGAAIGPTDAIRADIARARAAVPNDPVNALLYDYLDARLDAETDVRAIERLRRVARAARADTSDSLAARVATAAAEAALADAGARGMWPEAAAIAAEANRVSVPARCALIVGADDFRFVAVSIDGDGGFDGVFERDALPSADWLAPASLRARLHACPVVDVLAMPSWYGVGPLLDPELPWRYVLGPRLAPATHGASGEPAHASRKHVIVADVLPPPALHLPALTPWSATVPPGAALLAGREATPERVASEIIDAAMIELHVHTDRVSDSDAPALALSEGVSGWALTAEAISRLSLANAPVVVLANCAGAEAAPYSHTIWGLPSAFRAAGARAVVAPMVPVPDAEATAVFGQITGELERGVPIAVAVAHARAAKIAGDLASWIRYLVVFE